MAALLTSADVEKHLKAIPAWTCDEELQRISRTFEFPDFGSAMVFVNDVAQLAEEKNHHPDMHITYSKVTIELTTHSSGGLTEKDFAIAGEIDAIQG